MHLDLSHNALHFVLSTKRSVWQTPSLHPAVLRSLAAAVNSTLKSPDVRERLIALGTEVAGGSPEQVQAFLDNEVEKWAHVATYKTITAE